MPHYTKAPITEALIDIRVEKAQVSRFEDLRGLKATVSSEYPLEETRTQGLFQFGPTIAPTAQQKPWALVFTNKSNNQVFQARLDGFTFSRLQPYETFERLRDEARRLWNIYREFVRPQRITRVAVRYINQLNLQGPSVEPEEYFNTFPQISTKLPRELRDFGPFLMNLTIPQPDLKGALVLNQGNTPPKTPDIVPIVLDFDLFVDNPPVTNEQELWSFFDRLRERKNLYFEACITDKTRELIR